MWPRRASGVAGGVDQRPAERFRRNADVEGDHFRGDRAGRVPGDAAVERTVDGDDIGGKVVPGHGERAVGAHERHGADGSSRSAGVVGAVRDKARSPPPPPPPPAPPPPPSTAPPPPPHLHLLPAPPPSALAHA